jgi:hypothetical protein
MMEREMKRLATILMVSALLAGSAFATNIPGGSIGVNTNWNLAGSPYVIQGNVNVTAGVTLTIDAGVQVKFDGLFSLSFDGNLAANGTSGSHVVFTTNNGVPAAGQWSRLIFNGVANGNLSYCDIRYGGYSQNDMVELNGGYVTIANCNLTNSQKYGIALDGGSGSISGTTISTCDWAFYQNTYVGTITFGAGNNFTGNTHSGVYLAAATNFTGNDTLPNPGVPYYAVNGIQVQAGATFTIEKGNIIKFPNSGYLNVYGTLLAVGGSAAIDNIYFTDYRDDVWGGDLNGDGIATGPAVNWWYGINFYSGSSPASRVDNCKIRYTGYAAGVSTGQFGGCVNIFNCGPKIKRNDMSSSYFSIRVEGVTTACEIDSNTFGIATSTPVALSFEAFPSFQDNTFSSSNNGYDAIGILPGALTGNAVLPQRNVTSIPNVTYVLLGSVTVPSTRTLTINQGVVIKFLIGDYEISVDGTFVANGGAGVGQQIIFTSVRDDNWGNPNDTNNDGSTTTPAAGNWGRIRFNDPSTDGACQMSYCKIFYGGYQYYIYNERANVQTSFASPSITHCDFANTTRALTLFGNSNPDLRFNTYTNTQTEPVELSAAANPTFGSETMTNVGYRALGILPETLPGNGSIIVRNFAGFTNITYILSGSLAVPAGAILTISPTVVIKGTSSQANFDISGTLNATGTVGNLIVFTSVKDDIYGNPLDTNGDGSSTTPSRSDWYGIFFEDVSVDAACVLDYCVVKYANNGVDSRSAGPLINHSTISDNLYGVMVGGNGNPRVWNTAINNAYYTPIIMSLASDPDFQNLTFNGDGLNGLGILEGTLSGTGHLKRRDVAGITGIAYVSLNSVDIASGGDLIIDPGVVIKMYTYYISWNVEGKIHAIGKAAADSTIAWTSISDDSRGGDTNNNGNATQPGLQNWYYISVNDAAIDTACIFKYCKFYYGNYNPSNNNGALCCVNSAPMIQNCEFGFQYFGVGIYGSAAPALSNNTFLNMTYSPIIMDLLANPTFSGDAFFNVGYASISLRAQNITIDATWPQRNFAGYTNITYTLLGELDVASGATLQIPAGTVIKGINSGSFINVNGALKINGTSGNRVVFTSYRDDSYGNPFDTNQDGSTSPPVVGDFGYIQYNDISVDANSVINYMQMNYAYYGLVWSTAAAPCNESNFYKCNWGFYIQGASNPTLTNFNVTNSVYAPIAMSLASNPTFVGGSLSNNAFQAIQIFGETTSADYTLPRRNVAGDINIVYLLYNATLTVGSNSILTIQPGVVIKLYGSSINVNKGLQAVSNSSLPDSQIVFTSYRDDFYGGDTNNDGDVSAPLPYDWGHIEFEDISLDPLCKMKNCVVRFGDNGGGYGLITCNNSSPTIQNSLIADAYTGVRVNGASNPVVNNCDLVRLTGYGVQNVSGSFIVNAENNWWGSNTGPTHSGNPGGTGVASTNSVDYLPFTTANSANPRLGDVSLNAGITAYDAALILLWIVNPVTNPLNALQLQVADVTAAGGVTSLDASYILQFVAGLIDYFPGETTIHGKPNLPRDRTLDATAATLQMGEPTAGADNTFDLPLLLRADGSVWSGYASLTLPPGCEFVSFTTNVPIQHAAAMQDGNLNIAFASAKPLPLNTAFATLRVRVAADAGAAIHIGCQHCLMNEGAPASFDGGNITATALPQVYALQQNYPNPFNPSTTIPFLVPHSGNVRLTIYDLLGRRVADLMNGSISAGQHSVVWNGQDERGRDAASGTYIVRMSAEDFTASKTIRLMK